MPSAIVWKAVAEVLTKGITQLELSARWAVLIGALLGILLEALRVATKGRFWLSGVGLGLATLIPFNTCLAMFLGPFFFWLAKRIWKTPGTSGHKLFLQNLEPICAGVIAGGAITGIAVILLENFVL
jgi:uncharacterized oligopeptide transporter (OPT) family protein